MGRVEEMIITFTYLFFLELLQSVSIVQEDERSRKNALPVAGCRMAVFTTQKSQLCVFVSTRLLMCTPK